MTNDNIERPLDLLNSAKGKRVLVETKAKKQIMGILKAFDIHINIVLADAEERNEEGQVSRKIGEVFIRGDMIVLVAPAP
ncbi:MAG TPA: LSM domain-containing protein [Candidatus Nanoarchaeia archaeon]|nr:LSM domain-containing protein [Candidatus Nanoarchaeia archaeon]